MKKKGKHLLYKDPELIKNNEGGFIVNFNSVAASGFLTLKDPFNSTYLKLMKNRIVYYQGQRNEIMEENPNIQLDEGFSKLAKIEKMWGISEPFPKMRKISQKELHRRLFQRKTIRIMRLLKEGFHDDYICMTLNCKLKDIVLIKKKMSKKKKSYLMSRGRKSIIFGKGSEIPHIFSIFANFEKPSSN